MTYYDLAAHSCYGGECDAVCVPRDQLEVVTHLAVKDGEEADQGDEGEKEHGKEDYQQSRLGVLDYNLEDNERRNLTM